MRALVTGPDGLLGSHLVRRLCEAGADVCAFVQRGSRAPTLDGLPLARIEGDLLDDGPGLAQAVRDRDVVFHCAAITDLWAPSELTWKVNESGTRRVVEACLADGARRRLVFGGSASSFAFGPLHAPGDERGGFPAVYRGVAYAESKAAATSLVLEAVRDRGLDAVVVAPTFMLGALDARPSSGELIRQYVARPLPLVSGGGRCFAHADDVAAALVAAAERGERGAVYIAGGANLTYRDFFARVARVVGLDPPRGVLPDLVVSAAGGLATAWQGATGRRVALDATTARLALCGTYYDSSRAVRELDMPQTPVDDGIADTIAGLRAFGHLRPDPHDPLTGKVALVTGASRGVGLGLARQLVMRGAAVVMTARGARRLEASHAALVRLGGAVEAVVGDVADWADAERMVAAAIDRFGRLDIVINNAGVSMRGQFVDLDPGVCRQTIDTNLLGAVYVTRAAIPHVVAASGHVVFVSSIAGLLGLPGASTYCASKGALTGLAESLRLELGPRGVHVGVAHLGFTEHDPEKTVLAADGTGVAPDRPAHHTQAQAARRILAQIVRREPTVVMTPVGHLARLTQRLSPSGVQWAIARAQAAQWGLFRKFS